MSGMVGAGKPLFPNLSPDEGPLFVLEGPSRSSADVLSVREELECLVCLDFAPSPVHSCANGHITCGVCVEKLREKKCSMCSRKLRVSAFAERMVKKLEVRLACLNNADGCKEMVLSTAFKKHLNVCEFRPISCYEGTCDGRKVPFSEYFDHFQQNHKIEHAEAAKEVSASDVFIDPMAGKLVQHTTMIRREDGKVFLEKEYRNQTMVYMTAELLGSKEEADKLRFQVTVKTLGPTIKNVSISYEGPIFPIHSNDEPRKPLAYFASFPRSLWDDNRTRVSCQILSSWN